MWNVQEKVTILKNGSRGVIVCRTNFFEIYKIFRYNKYRILVPARPRCWAGGYIKFGLANKSIAVAMLSLFIAPNLTAYDWSGKGGVYAWMKYLQFIMQFLFFFCACQFSRSLANWWRAGMNMYVPRVKSAERGNKTRTSVSTPMAR